MTDLADHLQASLGKRYHILREIGRGGMAVVFLADDLKHERRVALKVLDPGVVGGVAAERFHQEIRVAAGLQHPHVLPLFDSGEADGLFYYVMPYVEGESLRQTLDRKGRLSTSKAVRLVRQLAAGLAHAHQRGLVHRDIKPENVLLSDGHPVLADFGIVQALDAGEEGRLTRTGVAVGTPAYMSPEQWDGSELDGRSDQYSLACVLYELVVGEPPFSGPTTASVMAGHCTGDPASLREARPSVPRHVDEAVARALAKEPEERFPSVESFADALTGGEDGDRVRLGLAPEGWRAAGRRLSDPRVLFPMVLLAVAGAAAFLLLRPTAGPPSGPQRVAVGLFENRTGDPALDDLGRMAEDWITGGLQRTGLVKVVPSPTAVQASNFVRQQASRQASLDPVTAFARETGADVVVSGSYYRSGADVEFQVQVADASRGELVGSLPPVRGPPDTPETTIERLRERVMGLLALSIDERLAEVTASAADPPSFEAYRAFNRGLDAYIQGRFADAVPHLRQAHDRDSTFVLPLLYAAINQVNLGRHAEADSLLRRLDGVGGGLNEYHRRWQRYLQARLRGDNEEARTAIRAAAEMAPGSKAAYNAAWMAIVTNRPGEALTGLQSLDPERGAMRGWFPYWRVLTEAHHRLGRHEEELEAALRARRLFPERSEGLRLQGNALAALGRSSGLSQVVDESTGYAETLAGQLMVGFALELRVHEGRDASDPWIRRAVDWFETEDRGVADDRAFRAGRASALQVAGRWSEARDVVAELRRDFPADTTYRIWLGILAAGSGDEAAAREVYEWLGTVNRPYAFGVYHLQRARIAALLGERQAAVGHYRRALNEGQMYPRHPGVNFHAMRDYPPLRALLEPGG